MKYKINTTNYHTFDIFEVNKLPGRTYFIPYRDRDSADAVTPKERRYKSDKVTCLNGDWDFKFYANPKDMPSVIDTDKTSFDTIDVPACWQFRGYDKPFYINIRYQFPYKPPVIPTTEKVGRVFSWIGVDQGISLRWKTPDNQYNFVGVYRKKISIEDVKKGHIISFMGVASCLDLYVNGKFAGYSEGAHNIAEFDISDRLVEGENELLAVVHRWCTGTYLESQDMFRNNGIFRDVLLYETEPSDIKDICAVTKKSKDAYSLTMTAEVYSDCEVTFTIEGEGISESQKAVSKDGIAKAEFTGLSVKEWTAEEPKLYTMYYETETSCVRQEIGFKTVEIIRDVFLLNGKKIKFHGVNHHDTSPTNGYTMTPDEIERDVLLCKEYNIDMIRTSHYPPDPLLLELCDIHGIYIVDENDLETHGTFAHQLPPTYNSISHDPKWKGHYLDRIKRLYERDKVFSNTCIIMWSLGNEAGGYCNTDAMYDFLKSKSTLPVHYESAIHSKREAYDVGSEMYPSVQMVHDVGEHRRRQKRLNDRPYFMCEYAHAMGVGPGNTEAYWKEVYAYDNLMGGCVWEMVDHGVADDRGGYTYGGDHGEWSHDGNFCVDGIFYPDRRPSVGAKIIRFIYRPIRITYLGEGEFEIFNTTAFSSGSRYSMSISWNDGSVSEYVPEADPLEKHRVKLTMGNEVAGNLTAIATTTDTLTGRVVSEEELIIKSSVPKAVATCMPDASFNLTNGKVTITLKNKKKLVSAEPGTILYRARTDNDTNPMFKDTMAPYCAQTTKVVSTAKLQHGFLVKSIVKNKKAKYEVTDTYEGVEGGILVTSHIHCVSGGGYLPRFGKTYRLDESFDEVSYTGRCGESYCDMKDQFVIRDVECRVSDMTEPNIRPQESGNRCDCTGASISDGEAKVSFIAVERPFELGIKPYSDDELIQMKHVWDEKRTGTYVTIQAFQQGIGTGACGPEIAEEYLYSAKHDYEFSFIIKTE